MQISYSYHVFSRKLNKFKKSVKILKIILTPSFVGVCDLIIKIDLQVEVHIYLWIFSIEKTTGKWTVELSFSTQFQINKF